MQDQPKKEITHPELVTALCKSGEDIVKEMTRDKAHLTHMAMCIPEEAGEIAGLVKKYVIYNKPLSLEKIIEEMGDLEFYLEGLRQGLGVTREQVLDGNIFKLQKRYSSGSYSDNQANERADKESESD